MCWPSPELGRIQSDEVSSADTSNTDTSTDLGLPSIPQIQGENRILCRISARSTLKTHFLAWSRSEGILLYQAALALVLFSGAVDCEDIHCQSWLQNWHRWLLAYVALLVWDVFVPALGMHLAWCRVRGILSSVEYLAPCLRSRWSISLELQAAASLQRHTKMTLNRSRMNREEGLIL